MPTLVELLVKVQLLDDRQHDAVMSRSRSASGGHVVQQIAEMGYATEGAVARALSVELGLPRIDLSMTPPEAQALSLLDARLCAERFVLPVALREDGELLWLAMADPTDQDALTAVKRRTQKRVRPAVAGPSEILRTARLLYSTPQAGSSAPEKVDNAQLAALEIAGQDEAEAAPPSSDEPIARLAQQLGVAVPEDMPSRRKAPPVRPPEPDGFDELFATRAPSPIAEGPLTPEQRVTLEALRASMEKGALVLRALAELCVEKGVLTRDEMKRRRS